MPHTVSLHPDGFEVSNDNNHILASFLTTALNHHADNLTTLFTPDGEGLYIPSLGGALRIEERESLRPPYDEDPQLDPGAMELWSIQEEIPFTGVRQIVITGDELRALLAEAQRLRTEQAARARPKTEPTP